VISSEAVLEWHPPLQNSLIWLGNPITTTKQFQLLLLALCLALGLAIVLSVAVGAVPVPFATVLQVIGVRLGILPEGSALFSATDERIVWVFRLPRVLLGMMVGAALAVSGTTLQAVARNPLADPFIFGISYGASVGAVLVLSFGWSLFGGFTLAIAAFAGALVATTAVYLLAQQQGSAHPLRLVLAGVALSYLLSAVTSYLVLRASIGGGTVASVLAWLAGSLARAEWSQLGLPGLVILLVTGYLLLQSRQLNALLMGDESATGLGVNVERFRFQLFVLTSLLVGVVVAISGAIGFVGLMVPHVVRLVVGSDHRRVLPLAALGGALLLVVVDMLGRLLIAPQELPVGIVTAVFGGPFFLWLLRSKKGVG
jgi:iron complex transport system permease protein